MLEGAVHKAGGLLYLRPGDGRREGTVVAQSTLTSILMIALFAACGQQNTQRQNLDTQGLADSKAKFEDLAPAEGNYSGQLHLIQSGQDFTMNLEIRRTWKNVHPSGAPDPTQIISVPILTGNLKFPAVENAGHDEFPSYSELLIPMAGYPTVLFDSGDFDPQTKVLQLPYTAPNRTADSYGEFSATLSSSGHLSGTWTSKPVIAVGTYELDRISSSVGAKP